MILTKYANLEIKRLVKGCYKNLSFCDKFCEKFCDKYLSDQRVQFGVSYAWLHSFSSHPIIKVSMKSLLLITCCRM